jgi:arsenate reductase
MTKVMFLCTANSCRSQMAEGLAKHYGDKILDVYSAGSFASRVHPIAIAAMKEIGIDISGQESKGIDRELLEKMDIIITLCTHAEAMCPMTPPGIKRLHCPIKDPFGTFGSDEVIFQAFRNTRDEIKQKIIELVNEIKNKH